MRDKKSMLPNMEAVRKAIAADPVLTEARKASVRSAISVACRWIGKTPETTPASVALLRERLARLEPAMVGAAPKRFSTVKSDLLFALRHTGVLGKSARLEPLSPEWQLLWDRLPDKYARTALSRLFRFASARGIAPAEIDDDMMVSFRDYLADETLIKNPKVTQQTACRVWNRVATMVEGWPTHSLAVPRYAEHYILDWKSFPVTFKKDVDALIARLGRVDILSLDGPPRALKPRTLKTYCYELRRFASTLVHQGHQPGDIVDIAYLVRPKHVEDGLRFLLDRSGGKPMRSASDIATLLANVARHWVKTPAEDIAKIKAFASRVRPDASGLGIKNRQRLLPLRNPKNLARLFLLPGKLAKEVGRKAAPTRADSLVMQQAVALAILTHAPIRIGNLAGLHIDRNLRWSGPQLIVDIDAADVKNEQTLSFPLPVDVAALVRTYLDHHQPRLVDGPSAFLFPGPTPLKPKRADTLGKQLTKLVRATVGLDVNPHLFRHLVHVIVLNRYPGAYAMISRILGHKSLQTAIANYASEDIAISMRSFQELVADARAGRVVKPGLAEVVRGMGERSLVRRA